MHVHLVRGSVGVMASTAVAAVTGWLFWVVATQHWPEKQIGVSTSLIAALTSIALLAGQPIATSVLLRVPRSTRRSALVGVGVGAAIVLAAVGSIVALAVLPATVGVVRTVGLATLFSVGAAAAAAAIVLDASALAIRRPGLMVARNGLHGAGKLAIIGILSIPAGLTAPFAVVGSWATLSVVTAALEWWGWHRAVARETMPDAVADVRSDSALTELRAGFGLQAASALGGALPPQLLPILVVAMLGRTQAGWFSITWLVGSLCFMISPAVSQALLAEGALVPAALDRTTRAAVVLSAGLLVVPVLVYVTAGHFVLGLFGSTYASHGTTLLVVLAISSVPDLITNVAVARFRVQGRLGAAAAVNVSIGVVAVGGTAWSLHRRGILGAGWSWALAETVGCLVLVVLAGLGRRATAGPRVAPGSTSTATAGVEAPSG